MATTAPTVSAVMTASPTPMTACQVSMKPASWPRSRRAAPPTAYRPTKTSAAAGTETKAPTAEAGTAEDARLGRTAMQARETR